MTYEEIKKCEKRLRVCWHNMIQNCHGKPGRERTRKCYQDKGVKVCKEWKDSFADFYDWAVTHGFAFSKQINRIDKDGDFCPENCEWIDAKEVTDTLAINLKRCREKAGKTQNEVGAILGVSKATICNWECAMHVPTLLTVHKMAVIYGCTVDEFLAGVQTGLEGGETGA